MTIPIEDFKNYDSWKTSPPYYDAPDHLEDCPMNEDNHDGDPAECTCPTPAELKDDAAEARADARKEDFL